MSCVVKGCRSHTGRTESKGSVTFHTFPKNEDQKEIWLRLVNRPSWTWHKRSRICSKHFTAESFLPNPNIKWRRLNPNALPILNMPDDDVDEEKIHKEEAIYNSDNESEASNISAESFISNEDDLLQHTRRRRKSKTICYQHLATISKLQRELEKVKKVSTRRLKKINSLSKRYSRLNKQHYDFVCTFMDKLKKGNIDTEYLTLFNDLNKIGH